MNFKLIVAVDKNNGIGKNNKIPWYFSEDLKYFAKMTKGSGNNAIIMGRKTYESIGNYPLTKRTNIIISYSYKNISSSKHKFVTSPEEAINFCTTQNFDEVWIIGGATIYDYFLRRCVGDVVAYSLTFLMFVLDMSSASCIFSRLFVTV